MNPVAIGLWAAVLFLSVFALLLAVLFRLWAVDEREHLHYRIDALRDDLVASSKSQGLLRREEVNLEDREAGE